jgi:hypothetical protein
MIEVFYSDFVQKEYASATYLTLLLAVMFVAEIQSITVSTGAVLSRKGPKGADSVGLSTGEACSEIRADHCDKECVGVC